MVDYSKYSLSPHFESCEKHFCTVEGNAVRIWLGFVPTGELSNNLMSFDCLIRSLNNFVDKISTRHAGIKKITFNADDRLGGFGINCLLHTNEPPEVMEYVKHVIDDNRNI